MTSARKRLAPDVRLDHRIPLWFLTASTPLLPSTSCARIQAASDIEPSRFRLRRRRFRRKCRAFPPCRRVEVHPLRSAKDSTADAVPVIAKPQILRLALGRIYTGKSLFPFLSRSRRNPAGTSRFAPVYCPGLGRIPGKPRRRGQELSQPGTAAAGCRETPPKKGKRIERAAGGQPRAKLWGTPILVVPHES